MKQGNPDLWIRNLEIIYEQAINAKTKKAFFLSLAEYVDYIGSDPNLLELSNIFDTQRVTDCEEYEEAKDRRDDYVEKLLKRLRGLKVDHPLMKLEMKDAFRVKDGRAQVEDFYGSIFQNLGMAAFRISEITQEKQKQKALRAFNVSLREDNSVREWEGNEISDDLQKQETKLKRIRQIRGWFSWEKLKVFYTTFTLLEERIEENRYKFFEAIKWSGLGKEIDTILFENEEPQFCEFKRDDYQVHLQRIHRHFLNEIDIYANVLKGSEEPSTHGQGKISFKVETQFQKYLVINVGSKEVKFNLGAKKTALFKKLLSKKEVYYSEIVQDLEGASTDCIADLQNNYYELCRGIQMSFAKHTITNFLIFDYTSARINPIYKKAKD